MNNKPTQALTAIILLILSFSALANKTLTNHFIGISGDLLTNVENRLNLKQPEKNLLTKETIHQLNNEAPKEIDLALQPYGYFKNKVTSKLFHIGGNWHAFYHIKLGSPMLINNVDLVITGPGSTDPKIAKFSRKFTLKLGSILNTVKYKQLKQDFIDIAATEGYILAKIEKSEIHVDTEKNIASIFLHCDTGPRYYFGPITFSKNPLKDDLLKKFLTYKEGEFYSTIKVHNSQDNLNNSNLFSQVTIEPEYQQIQDLKVPITVHITPRKSQQYSFGLGYGTDTGTRGLFGFELYNFAPNGQHINGLIKASSNGLKDTKGTLEMHYIIPGKNPITDQYDIGIASNIKELDFGRSTLVKGGFGYTTSVFSWQQIARLDVLHEWWRFDNEPRNQTTMLLPNIMWMKKKVNTPINPTAGYRINLLAHGTSKYIASNLNFLQTDLDAKFMYPIIKKGPILILRGNIGYTFISDKDSNSLPLSFWFTAGGFSSIRGYSYEQIGPGKELTVANIELQQKLFINDLYGSIFYDLGNAANDIFTIHSDNPFYKHQGVGIGLNYLSPIGTIRLSYAKAIDRPGAPGRIQFSIGPEL